jgi:hypothetical protein
MATRKNKTPDFFSDESFDPIEVATGTDDTGQRFKKTVPSPVVGGMTQKTGTRHIPEKKKAGFYLSIDLLDRFARKFYELKLAGIAVENKSALLELALSFALDDMDKGLESRVLRNIGKA